MSPKACEGILHRAAKRGKELPPQLRRALEASFTLTAHGQRIDGEGETLLPIAFNGRMGPVPGVIPGAIDTRAGTQCVAFDTTQITSPENRSTVEPGAPCHPLAASAKPPAIAFSCKDYGADVGDEVAPTLRAMGHTTSHANAGGQLAIAYGLRSDAGREGGALTPSADAEGRVRLRDPGFNVLEECAPTIDTGTAHTVATAWAVRRLTPMECERLQGVPDGYTNISRKGKPIADGPRYKMLGNTMATNVMHWLGASIDRVERIIAERAEAPARKNKPRRSLGR